MDAMTWQQTPYTVPLLVIGVFLLLLGLYIARIWWTEEVPGSNLAALLMLASAEWVFANVLALSSVALHDKLVWNQVEYLGLLLLPVLWYFYVSWYTEREAQLTRRRQYTVVGIATALYLLALTNHRHELLWTDPRLDVVMGFNVLEYGFGPGFWAFFVFAYGLLFYSTYLLIGTAYNARGVFRWQATGLMLISLVPGTGGIIDAFELAPWLLPGVNLAALGTVSTAAIGALTVFRFGWFDLSPVAREQVLADIHSAIFVLDNDHRLIDFNERARSLLGPETTPAVGAPLARVFPQLAETISVDRDQRELTVDSESGTRIFDVRVSEVERTGPRTSAQVVILSEITARERARERLRSQRERIEQLHLIAQDLTAARREQDVYDEAVAGAREVLDCDAVELVRLDGGELAPLASIDSDRPPGDAVADGGAGGTLLVDRKPSTEVRLDEDVPGYEAMLAAPVGENTEIRALTSEAGDFDTATRQVIELLASHIQTALERVSAEADLREERDRMEEFASVVSHDLRNPLTVARGRVDLAKTRTDDEAVTSELQQARDAHDRMEEIIGNVLTLAREGRDVGETTPVSLDHVASAAWTSIEADADIHIDDGQVEADTSRLRELLENLFRNSVEHGSDGVTIRVGPLASGFYVEDDGPGIPEKEREQVFDHGYSTANGTGLGLTIVETIAEAHDWDVSVTESESGGARFEIR